MHNSQRCNTVLQTDWHNCYPSLTKIETSRQILVKLRNTKFHEHPLSGSRAWTDDWIDMAKLTGALLRIFVGNETKQIILNFYKIQQDVTSHKSERTSKKNTKMEQETYWQGRQPRL
jgi:hypothetical protein